jgi:DNA mismatch endonuclease (patch repair protein)
MTAVERTEEQDHAAGGRDNRVVVLSPTRSVLASVCLRLPPQSRRIYAYLRWSEGRKTREKYICQVSAPTREENLSQAWQKVQASESVRPVPHSSWASSTETRQVMRGNRSRDTSPEMALRSAVHARGLRYRVCARPVPQLRRTADLVFSGPRIAVFVDGCFWHGCPDHYRPSTRNSSFWIKKLNENRQRDQETDRLLDAAGWTVIRIWEHEQPQEAAKRIERAVLR